MDEPRREAVALQYDPADAGAPVVIAMGTGFQADRLIEAAKAHDVPIVPDADLAHVLTQLSVGDEIPQELYAVVAKVLVFISELDESFAARMVQSKPRQ